MLIRTIVFVLSLSLLSNSKASADLIFNFTEGAELAALAGTDPGLRTNVLNGFQAAGALWSDLLSDDVEVNVAINFDTLGANILGGALNSTAIGFYGDILSPPPGIFEDIPGALAADAMSADDALVVANLQTGIELDFISSDRNGNDIRPTIGNFENWSVLLSVARANLKALGLIDPMDAATDASITFSDTITWDFDRSDGISGGAFDFVGVAAHEIGHALGYTSGVDTIDANSGPGGNATADLNVNVAANEFSDFAIFSLPDLFRYSADSLAAANQPANGGLLDLRAGGNPFFSIDGGATSIAPFDTGVFNGSGRQASHWEDGLGLGILDPTFAPGELGVITDLDVQALDVIGWNLASAVSVPEPSHVVIYGMLGLALIHRRRQTAI